MTEANEMQEARKDIEQLLDHIDEDTSWNVTGYEPNIDPYVLTKVTFTVEKQTQSEVYNPESKSSEAGMIKEFVAKADNEFEKGAPVSTVIEWIVDELDVERSKAEHKLEKLKSKGEIYEPNADHLRTT